MAEKSYGNPFLDAAARELRAIHAETGGGDAFNPNRSPEYRGALRLWQAMLDQRSPLLAERRAYRVGEKRFQIVDAKSSG